MTESSIGSRGVLLAHTPFLPYKDAFRKCLKVHIYTSIFTSCILSLHLHSPLFHSFLKKIKDPFHPDTNPQGYISLCVAENKLVVEELATYLSQPHMAQVGFQTEPQLSFCYSNFMGLAPLRQSVATFFTRKFKCIAEENEALKPEHIVVGSGCAGLLNVLFCLLADEKDAVLIPAPYYAAFDNDMKVCIYTFLCTGWNDNFIVELDTWIEISLFLFGIS